MFLALVAKASVLSSVFLIVATNTFVQFLHFKFDANCEEYLHAQFEDTQIALISDEDKETCVHMSSIKWYNLQLSDGRQAALCHVMALLRWHDAQDSAARRLIQ